MFRNRILPTLVLAVAVVAIASAAIGADKKKENEQKRREYQNRLKSIEREESIVRQQIQSLEKQVPQLKKKLQSNQQALQAMTGQARMARQQLEDAKAETKRMSKEHEGVAEEVVAEQSAYSPFGELRDKCASARKDYADAVDTVKYSDPYKKAGSALVRKGLMDNDSNVIATRELLVRTLKQFEAARIEVLRDDPDWHQSMNDLKATKEQEKRVDDQTKSVLGRYATAQHQVNNTKRGLVKLEARIQTGRRALSKVVNFKNNFKRQYGHLGKKR